MPHYIFLYLLGWEEYMLPCMNKALFGIDCPGCGMQRSVALLIRGDFVGAFYMYPAVYPLLALLLFLISSFFVTIKFEQQIKIFLGVLSGATIIVSYIIKMNFLTH